MDETIGAAVPALIALVGTLVAIFIGYRQWKSQRDQTRSQKFQEGRELAYKQLWEKLEEVHLKVRSDSVGKRDFDELVQEVNAYLLKNSLYVAKADRKLATEYLDAVWKLSQLVAKSKDKRIQSEWAKTGPLPADALDEYRELQTAWKIAEESRDKAVARFQNVLAGKGKSI
jgi:hypothetical protein